MKPLSFLSLLVAVLSPLRLVAQSDSFDNYSTPADLTAAGWKLSALSPALVTTTFPAVGTGKGIRLQANPLPGAAPAVVMYYRTNIYSDYYIAIDIAAWPGTDKDQALVLFARLTDSKGAVPANLSPADAQGLICNYDTSQHGENPQDRRQGQLQINTVGPGFDANTLAAADITFIPGRSYRLIFEGIGSALKARAYDLNDLTGPLVTLDADDSTYSSGACGVLVFSRNDNTGTADATFDNYFAAAKAPEALPSPALAHPVPGTPAVVARVPAARFQNFDNPTNGLSFTVDLNGADYDSSKTKLRLNGVETPITSTNLSIGGRPAAHGVMNTPLPANTVFTGEIDLQDRAGAKTSTNTFWFDTFSDSFLTNAPVKMIEAEDYNYNGGQFQRDPIPVSGLNSAGAQVNGNGVGYFALEGVPDIDYHDNGTQPGSGISADYRATDFVGTQQGEVEVENGSGSDILNDTQRSQYAALDLPEYEVRRFDPGEWMNYTRVFEPTNYNVYLRAASFGETLIEFDSVTSDPTQPNQTTKTLGTFVVPNTFLRSNYRYIPLTDPSGKPAVLNLAGTNTVRLTQIGTAGQDARKVNVNYILFVPAAAAAPAGVALEATPVLGTPFQEVAGATVDLASKTITVPLGANAAFYRLRANTSLRITSIHLSAGNVVITWQEAAQP